MSILTVGIGQTYATLGAAVFASAGGDTINVLAGSYVNDFTTIDHALTINGVGGLAHFFAAAPPTNGKGIMTVNADLTINALEFSGAAVTDGNGAGIRYQAGDMVIRNSWFHDNQDGILAGPNVAGTGAISIDHSEFNNNGAGDGQTHNLYVGNVASLSVTNSYFHDAIVGHEIKSRAASTTISGNVIADGPNTGASYSIDLPNGGLASITGNVIEKGPATPNWIYVAVGEEAPPYANTAVTISGNTLINDMAPGANPYALLNPSSLPVTIADNQFYGFNPDVFLAGPATLSGNSFLPLPGPPYDTSHPFNTSQPLAVPEPMSITLLLPFLALVVVLRRRFRGAALRKAHIRAVAA